MFSKESNGPGNRKSGARGIIMEIPLSSGGISISSLAVKW